MKLILFVIFIIIEFNLILSKNLKLSDIFKGGKSKENLNLKNNTKSINTKNGSSITNQISFGVAYSNSSEMVGRESEKNSGPPIDDQSDNIDNTDGVLKKQILFIACCLKGGLISDEQILNAYDWALENNYLINDKYNINELAEKISKQFKSTFHNDWKIRRPKDGINGAFSSITKKGEEITKPQELRSRAKGNLNNLFKK